LSLEEGATTPPINTRTTTAINAIEFALNS